MATLMQFTGDLVVGRNKRRGSGVGGAWEGEGEVEGRGTKRD